MFLSHPDLLISKFLCSRDVSDSMVLGSEADSGSSVYKSGNGKVSNAIEDDAYPGAHSLDKGV